MADFRPDIHRLLEAHTKEELIDELAARTGTRTTSVNPLTESMFAVLAPDDRPRIGEFQRLT